jgi:hypothetical protein
MRFSEAVIQEDFNKHPTRLKAFYLDEETICAVEAMAMSLKVTPSIIVRAALRISLLESEKPPESN